MLARSSTRPVWSASEPAGEYDRACDGVMLGARP